MTVNEFIFVHVREHKKSVASFYFLLSNQQFCSSMIEETSCLLTGDRKPGQGFRTQLVRASVCSYMCWAGTLNSQTRL